MCVHVKTRNGDTVPIPPAQLIAFAYGKLLMEREPDRFPKREDEEYRELPEAAYRVARFRACGVPYWQCDYCLEPIPYLVVSYAPLPILVDWYPDTDAVVRHTQSCLRRMMPPEWLPRRLERVFSSR